MALSLTPEQRRIRAQIAAHARWANTTREERKRATKPTYDAFLAKFEREVDPDGVLPEKERRYRAKHAQAAHMLRLQLAASKARSRESTAT